MCIHIYPPHNDPDHQKAKMDFEYMVWASQEAIEMLCRAAMMYKYNI